MPSSGLGCTYGTSAGMNAAVMMFISMVYVVMWLTFPPSFFCYHRTGRGRRTYQAYHGALEHNAQSAVRHEHKRHGYGCERAGLEEQQPRMPLA